MTCFSSFGNKFLWIGLLIYVSPGIFLIGFVLASLPPGDYSGGYFSLTGIDALILLFLAMFLFPLVSLLLVAIVPIIPVAVFLYYAFAYSALYFSIQKDRRRRLKTNERANFHKS